MILARNLSLVVLAAIQAVFEGLGSNTAERALDVIEPLRDQREKR